MAILEGLKSCGLNDPFYEDKAKAVNKVFKELKLPFYINCSQYYENKKKNIKKLSWKRISSIDCIGMPAINGVKESTVINWLKKNVYSKFSMKQFFKSPSSYKKLLEEGLKQKEAEKKEKDKKKKEQKATSFYKNMAKTLKPKTITAELNSIKRLPNNKIKDKEALSLFVKKNFKSLKAGFKEHIINTQKRVSFKEFYISLFNKKSKLKSIPTSKSTNKKKINNKKTTRSTPFKKITKTTPKMITIDECKKLYAPGKKKTSATQTKKVKQIATTTTTPKTKPTSTHQKSKIKDTSSKKLSQKEQDELVQKGLDKMMKELVG